MDWPLALNLLGTLIAWPLAWWVYISAPRLAINRALGLVLFLGGAGNLAWQFSESGPNAARCALLVLAAVSMSGTAIGYSRILGALETPLAAPFRSGTWMRRGIDALAWVTIALPALALVAVLARGPPYPSEDEFLVFVLPSVVLMGAYLAYALAVTLSAYRRAPKGTPKRERAKWWTLSFGARDVILITGVALELVSFAQIGGEAGARLAVDLATALFPLANLVSVPLLAYGILRTQIFDIDLRLKAGVARATLAGIFAAVFFGVAFVLVPPQAGLVLAFAAGGFSAALLLFAIAPLQGFSRRVADRLLPRVQATEAYIATRKLEVYRAALEDALAPPAGPTPEDERLLADLRRSLGVTQEQHLALLVALRPRARRAAAPAGLAAQFEVERELGRGGSGRALLARDRALDRRVVLKQPLGLMAAQGERRETLLREARLAARIQHPHVVTVYQVLADEDPPVIVMEHVDGESLADLLARRGSLRPDEAARLALDVLAGLARIHREAIVHRDIKPANILLDREGRAKITDFGVAHDLSGAWAEGGSRGDGLAGLHPGSPAYMSPEQARGERLDARSDLYSLAVVLHEALQGRPYAPADGTRAAGALRVPVAAPTPLDAVLARALEPDPARRYADAAQMAEALAAAAHAAAPRPRE